MKSYVAISALLLSLTAAAPVSELPAVAKCSLEKVWFPPAPEHVYLLNGKRTTQEAIQQLHPDAFEVVEVLCATELHSVFGVESQRGGVSVFTKPGPHSALRAEMERITSLQNAHFKTNGIFASQLADLSWSDPAGHSTVSLQVSGAGRTWSAKGSHRYLLAPTSAVVVSGRAPVR
jgi:hypothetical protein